MRMPTTRIVPIDRDCPHCGDQLAMRQVGDAVDDPHGPGSWTDEEPVCRRGFRLTPPRRGQPA